MKASIVFVCAVILLLGTGCITPNYKYAWIQEGKSETQVKKDWKDCQEQLKKQPFAPNPLALVEDPVATDLAVRFIRSCMESKGYKPIDARK